MGDLLFVCPPELCPGEFVKCTTQCKQYDGYEGNCFPNLHRDCQVTNLVFFHANKYAFQVISRCFIMEARYKDFQNKRYLLDIWSETWDEKTTNKLRYFEKCVPANGIHSNRKFASWGLDENRAEIVIIAKANMERENPDWKSQAEKRKIWSKKRRILQINGYLKWIEYLQCSKQVNFESVYKRLETQKKREMNSLKIVVESYEGHLKFSKRKLENKRKQLAKRRKLYVEQETNCEKTELTELLNLTFDFPVEDLSKTPLVLQTHNSRGIEKAENNDLPDNFLDGSNENPNEVATTAHIQTDAGEKSEETSDRESVLTDFNCYSEKSDEREECKSTSDWFRSCSSCSRENDFEIWPNSANASDNEEEEIGEAPKHLLENCIFVEEDTDDEEVCITALSKACHNKECCITLLNSENIQKPIPCLREHITEMVLKCPQRVSFKI